MPFQQIEIPPARTHNARVPEPWAFVLREPDETISTQPPKPALSDTIFVPWLPEPPLGYTIPTHPAQLFTAAEDWDSMCKWWTHCQDQLRIAESTILRGKPYHGFDCNPARCPGGRDGLVIPFSRRAPEFAWTGWDLRDFNAGTGPIKPVKVGGDPQSRTTLNLQAMYDEALRTNYPDISYIEEILMWGLDSRAFVREDIVMVPNYKGLFEPENFKFCCAKRVTKSESFALDRMPAYGCNLPPFVHLYVNPRNVAIKPGSEPPKRRVTVDYAAPRSLGPTGGRGFKPARAKDPGPLSVNAAIDLKDPVAFPGPISYMDLRKLGRGAAQLQAIRACFPHEQLPSDLELFQVCDDMEMYYEQLPRPTHLDPTNVMLIWSVAGNVDERGCFGSCDMPYLSQRLEAFFVYVTSFRAREAQNETAIPPHLYKWLHAWGEARATAGGSGNWTIGGGYIDDTVNMCYQFFGQTLMTVKRKMWREFGLIVQDTKIEEHPVTAVAVKGEDMTALGVTSSPSASRLHNDPEKITKYSALAELVAETAREHTYRAPLELVDRCLGQLGFAASMDPVLLGDLAVVRDMVSASWARQHGHQVLVGERACEYLDSMAARLRHSVSVGRLSFRCYAPRRGLLGSTGIPILFLWTDASCANDTKVKPPSGMPVLTQIRTPNLFHGWGAMMWLEGDDTVYITQQFITYNARKCLDDSTACEMFGISEALHEATLLTQQARIQVEVAHIGDSQSATAIVNTGRPRRTAERVLFWQHCDLRDRLADTLLVSTNLTREKNQESDILASLYMHGDHHNAILHALQRAGQVKLQALVNARFGKYMKICLLPSGSLADSRQRMAVVVRAKASRARFANRSVLPQLLKTAGAYSRR